MSHTAQLPAVDTIPLPVEGPVLVAIRLPVTLDESQLDVDAISAFAAGLERIAPGRTSVVVLGPAADVSLLDEDELAALGLTRCDHADGFRTAPHHHTAPAVRERARDQDGYLD